MTGRGETMTNGTDDDTFARVCGHLAPFNRKGIELAPETGFAADLELDSLNVMDLVAAVEDEFDIVLPLNLLPELETVGDLARAVDRIAKG